MPLFKIFRCHENFYRPVYAKNELEKFKKSIEFLAEEFPKINYTEVKNDLLNYMGGAKSTEEDLDGIRFIKCGKEYKEKIGERTYMVKYIAK